MNIGRFKAILDAYGASPERWPERERADALALSRSSVVAARALADARTLDDALHASGYAELHLEPTRLAILKSRIVAAAMPRARSWLGEWFGLDLTPMQLWPSLAGLALMAVLGFAVGFDGWIDAGASHDLDESLVMPAVDISADGSGQ